MGFLGLSPTYWKEPRLAPGLIKVVVAEEWEERIDTIGRTFLGLTLACARCHDHKFDPVSQADYYALAGVLASTRLFDQPLLPPDRARVVRDADDGSANSSEPSRRSRSASRPPRTSNNRSQSSGHRSTRSRSRLPTLMPRAHIPWKTPACSCWPTDRT
ncbi:MAG: hypothetical protein CM1200mP2_59620 [Planctomycetaceae bacterium]|nr:MAG: hypothetical protein CM1200mP2_59620 [Planctomycetaceae bacterium]